MDPIRLNDEYTLDPVELVQSRLLIQGNSGCAKSSALRLIVEQIAGAIPTIIIDPEGEFYTVREVVPMILVGEGGEIPCDVSSAGRVARGLLESGVSAIVDLSSLHSSEQAPYVARFAGALMEAPRSLWRDMFIGIDEAHRFCPQSGKGNESGPQIIDLMKRGRKRGIGTGLVTQRVSSLNKDAAGEAANVFVGRTTLSNDIDRARATLGLKRSDAEVVRIFKRGEWFVHGPAIESDGVARLRVDRPQTKEPKRGSATVPPVQHSDAIAAIAAEVAELAADDRPTTLEEAQNMIDELTETLVATRRDAVAHAKHAAEQGKKQAEPVVDHDAVKQAAELAAKTVRDAGADAMREANEWIYEQLEAIKAGAREQISQAIRSIESRAHTVATAHGAVVSPARSSRAANVFSENNLPHITTRSRVVSVGPAPQPPARGVPDKMLYSLAWWLSVGVTEPSAAQVSIVGRFSKSGGTTNNARSKLRTSGLIETRAGAIVLTEAGRAAAPKIETPTCDEWHFRLRALLGGGAAGRLLDELIACNDSMPVVEREALCEAAGVSPTGGTTNNAMSKLRTLGLIERGSPVRATSLLNLGGLGLAAT